jgi:hypothetical protein
VLEEVWKNVRDALRHTAPAQGAQRQNEKKYADDASGIRE